MCAIQITFIIDFEEDKHGRESFFPINTSGNLSSVVLCLSFGIETGEMMHAT
jgi:hypothetical protein